MAGDNNLAKLIKEMAPELHEGEYVFVTAQDLDGIERRHTLCEFREKEGISLILERKKADELRLNYSFIASWITLTIHSSLEAVGLTATVSNALARNNITCNVIAGYHHDHLFVNKAHAEKAMQVLSKLSALSG